MLNNHARLIIGFSVAMSLSLNRSATAATGDFNGDGFDDLAISAVREDVGTVLDAGMIHVIYGLDAAGLNVLGAQQFTQDSDGLDDECERSDMWGQPAIGDFNGDGFDDLAVSAYREDVDGKIDAGMVQLLFGSATGLAGEGSLTFTQASPGIATDVDAGDCFGFDMCVGDFNGDGTDDLAISACGEDVNGVQNAGAVHILHGSPTGPVPSTRLWSQDSPGVLDQCELNDRFGYVVDAGDFNNDAFDDLVVSTPSEAIGTIRAGMVQVLYGSANGVSSLDQVWSQNSQGIVDAPESLDKFGLVTCVGDYNGDDCDDLAIAASSESLGTFRWCGAVHVLYGSPLRLRSAGAEFWHQDIAGIADQVEREEYFGCQLAAGDFDQDGRDELVISVREKLNTQLNAGAIQVLRGSVDGLRNVGSQYWDQNSPGVVDNVEALDSFGSSLATGDFDSDGLEDLAIGVCGEAILGQGAARALNVLYGSRGGLTAVGSQFFHQQHLGESLESEDWFGFDLGRGR